MNKNKLRLKRKRGRNCQRNNWPIREKKIERGSKMRKRANRGWYKEDQSKPRSIVRLSKIKLMKRGTKKKYQNKRNKKNGLKNNIYLRKN